ncbi:MAG: hypothetical protein JWP50_3207 [Phenylobacterium sp.]|nr:hypothetical protein [Phenylobacterium sp.]
MSPKSINDELDEQLADSFPASDPPSLTEPARDTRKREKEEKQQSTEKD